MMMSVAQGKSCKTRKEEENKEGASVNVTHVLAYVLSTFSEYVFSR